MTVYRIEQLEKKVDKHNQVVERMYEAEKIFLLFRKKSKNVNHRIEELEH